MYRLGYVMRYCGLTVIEIAPANQDVFRVTLVPWSDLCVRQRWLTALLQMRRMLHCRLNIGTYMPDVPEVKVNATRSL